MLTAVIILSILCAVLATLLVAAVYRLFQYDAFIAYIGSDIVSIVEFLKKLVAREMFSSSPEVVAAHQMFRTALDKMERYRDVISKRGIKQNLNTTEKPKHNRPVVID